jgi:hypothetical protein
MEMKTKIVQILIITILLTFGFTSAAAQKRVGSKKLREVKIYLVKATEEYDPKNPANLFPSNGKLTPYRRCTALSKH